MLFTHIDYSYFLAAVFAAYWLVRYKTIQNLLLLGASYFFYGYIHPWFCILIAISTVVDYVAGMMMIRKPNLKKRFLIVSLLANLGLLVFGYHRLGIGGRWQPQGIPKTVLAWAAMSGFTLFGWLLFRADNMSWLAHVLLNWHWGVSEEAMAVSLSVLGLIGFYSMPLFVMMFLDRALPKMKYVHAIFYSLAILAIMLFMRDSAQDFLYFQF